MYNNMEQKLEIIWEKNYPGYVRRKFDIPEISIYQMFKDSVSKYGSRESISFENTHRTYSELDKDVERIASGLSSLGLKYGDRLAILLPNCPQYVYLFLASAKIGVTIVNINPLYTFNEIKKIIDITKAKIIFVFAEFIAKIIDLFPTTLEKIVIVRTEIHIKNPLTSIPGLKNILFHEELPRDKNIMFMIDVGKNLPPVDEVPVNPKKDIASIHATGGIDGKPKTALISHYNFISEIYNINEFTKDISREDLSFIATPPFFHVFGLTITILFPLLIGARIEIFIDRYDLKSIIRVIEKNTNVFYPDIPTKFNTMIEDLGVSKISTGGALKIVSGASTLPTSLLEKFENKFSVKLCQGYGLTEACSVAAMCPNYAMYRTGSSGFPFPNTSVKIVDIKTGTIDMPLGETGELIVKGPQVIDEYLDEKGKRPVKKNGWLYTGDIAKIDEDGYIYIMGRKKEMIMVSSVGVYPYEIENIIKQNPKVEECAVIGVPDLRTGEAVVAFIEVKKNKTLTMEEILEFCEKNMYFLKVPSYVLLIDHLPRNVLGKVIKNDLKKWFMANEKQ